MYPQTEKQYEVSFPMAVNIKAIAFWDEIATEFGRQVLLFCGVLMVMYDFPNSLTSCTFSIACIRI
jgi:ABC-type uncharacterized transport system permease subunit